jgi:superfamily II RNA helicase
MPALADLLTSASSPDDTLTSFSDWAATTGRPLYPAQEEALLEIFAGSNVILNTPTGSGKSLVALGAHLAALAEGRRSMYTAPIKALVSEKFFSLCEAFGADQVGMVTGDATVNPNAPVLCGTAEILANMALRGGAGTPIDLVVMDEFHFYGDPERGWAWQVPLIEMTGAQWVLMSATLGDVRRFETGLTARTGRPTEVITSVTRPVPLTYEYRRTPIHETIESLLATDQAPVYVVHFTQASAVAQAQALTSLNVASRAQRDAIAAELVGFRFARGFGQTLARLLRFGVGVHHGGMLPKYRRLVERLTQAGLLRVICGTDTLGVGVNLPLRTVVFTGLAKYDGSTTRLLRAREFHQIAGRAGRAGYDASGLVVAQAPEHVIENERAETKAAQRAATDGRKARKVVKAKPPDGAIVWTSETFDRLVAAPPEPLTSHFEVSHTMLLEVLDRPGDGCAALRHLLVANDEPRPAQRRHIRRAISMYRSLVSSGALSVLPSLDDLGRRVKVTAGLQVDFALNSPLSPFVLAAIPLLDVSSPTWALDVLSVVESTLDDPRPILSAQLDRLKTETLGKLKAEGMEYEQRMEVLDKLEYPKPLREWTYDLFDQYRVIHPWAADHNIRPKSVARDLYERAMGFADYVAHYGLMRSEALVLRYLSDAYKGLVRNIPEDAKTEELLDITEWLGELVRQVDSSLIDEWQSMSSASGDPLDVATSAALAAAAEVGGLGEVAPPPVTANARAFRVMVRNAAFRRVELAARRDWAGLAGLEQDSAPRSGGWDSAALWSSAFEAYFASQANDGISAEQSDIGTGAEARSAQWFELAEGATSWQVTQTLDDPAGYHEWHLVLDVDLAASDAAGEAVIRTIGLNRL